MNVSARNVYAGTVKSVARGPVSAEVTVTIAPGVDVVPLAIAALIVWARFA